MQANPTTNDRLKKRAAYLECEELFGRFAERPSVLTVPNRWPFEARPGGAVTGAQLAATWARANDPAILQLSDDEAPETAASSLLSRTYGLIAAAFADKIIGRDGQRDVTAGMLKLISGRLDELYSGKFDQIIHGQVLPLVSIDHLERHGPNPLLYHPATGAINTDFLKLVKQALGRLIDRKRLRDPIDTEALASLFRELFSNTHLHARTDLSGTLYTRSARGIVFGLRQIDHPREADAAAGVKALHDYFLSMREAAARHRVEFLEVSVFDSGPGLAGRANRAPIPDDMPIGTEYALVRQCFLKNHTTEPDPAHGLGLPRVMLALKSCGGFMRLRTGRLSLYKAFPPGVDSPQFSEQDLDFLDLIGGEEISAHAKVAGAVFSILIPVGLGR
ncbi:hypothetical protein HFO17_11905 [Rhizobium laguerreae]|uniref:hypothetical protein n=1 Tax=Rhizobium laguerreae TaxID=1076926 RepID=UPI001C91F045|nr:hypothetical protein [Rhizobium laguerreae]MBY3235243.1 hypothetical protein [Rhizobium laguerreae]